MYVRPWLRANRHIPRAVWPVVDSSQVDPAAGFSGWCLRPASQKLVSSARLVGGLTGGVNWLGFRRSQPMTAPCLAGFYFPTIFAPVCLAPHAPTRSFFKYPDFRGHPQRRPTGRGDADRCCFGKENARRSCAARLCAWRSGHEGVGQSPSLQVQRSDGHLRAAGSDRPAAGERGSRK